jgi:hypothetical protein
MRRLATTLLFLLIATLTLAQTATQKSLPVISSTPAQTISHYPIVIGRPVCPINFYATRQAGGQIMTAGDAKQAGPAHGLHLTLNLPGGLAIESIEVTVYATSSRARVLPVDSASSDAVSKTFELHRTAGSASLNDADVWMYKVGSVSWADLISITYADGATWHATPNLPCRAIPSNFLPVGSK